MKKGLLGLAFLLIASSQGLAVFDYGDFTGNTVFFNDVGETEGYFGAPQVIGDSIIFSPADFAVESIGGGIDYKNGHMWMTMQAFSGRDIDSLELEEYGDWSLLGIGTANTYVSISGLAEVRIEQVEGVDLPNPLTVQGTMLYKKTNVSYWDDGIFNLADDGPAAELWEGELKFNIDQILADAGIVGKATRVYFTMDNILFATSENGSVAQIEKKDIGGFVVTVPHIPEPATMILLGLGGLLLRKR